MKVSQGKAGIYMKILLINGSSRPNGCTYTALREIAMRRTADELNRTAVQEKKGKAARAGLHRLPDLSEDAGPLRVR